MYPTKDLILAVSTGLLAYGGWPEPPRQFKELTNNVFFKWFLVFNLIWQGGANQDPKLAVLITATMFSLSNNLSKIFLCIKSFNT